MSASATTTSFVARRRLRSVSVACWAIGVDPKSSTLTTGSRLACACKRLPASPSKKTTHKIRALHLCFLCFFVADFVIGTVIELVDFVLYLCRETDSMEFIRVL